MGKFQSRRALKKRIANLELIITERKQKDATSAIVNALVIDAYNAEMIILRNKIRKLRLEVDGHEALNGKIKKFDDSLKSFAKKKSELKDYRAHTKYDKENF